MLSYTVLDANVVDVEKRRNPSKHYVSTGWIMLAVRPWCLLVQNAAGPDNGGEKAFYWFGYWVYYYSEPDRIWEGRQVGEGSLAIVCVPSPWKTCLSSTLGMAKRTTKGLFCFLAVVTNRHHSGIWFVWWENLRTGHQKLMEQVGQSLSNGIRKACQIDIGVKWDPLWCHLKSELEAVWNPLLQYFSWGC